MVVAGRECLYVKERTTFRRINKLRQRDLRGSARRVRGGGGAKEQSGSTTLLVTMFTGVWCLVSGELLVYSSGIKTFVSPAPSHFTVYHIFTALRHFLTFLGSTLFSSALFKSAPPLRHRLLCRPPPPRDTRHSQAASA